MTWINRLRLLGGLILVLVIVAGATFVLNQRESQVTSRSASIKAVSYDVASDYSGTVISRTIEEGDTVVAGDALLRIQSATLLRAQEADGDVPVSGAYSVSDGGIITLRATQAGVVSTISAPVGGFVDSSVPLVIIDREGSLFTLAEFNLDPYDFARIEEAASVDVILPDRTRIPGTMSSIKVDTMGGKALATVEITSDLLVRGERGGLVSPGTPVTGVLYLRDDGPLSGVYESFLGFVEKIGLGSFLS